MPSIKITLGNTEYDVPPMNVGQIEDVSALDAAANNKKWTYQAFAIVIRRAVPEIKEPREVEATPAQLRECIEKIMRNSGWDIPESKNGPAPE